MLRRKSWTYETSSACQTTTVATLEGYYFEDRHHDLDKFVGEWEGMGFGDHQWRARIIVQKKANYYDSYWYDALGLELSITKNGKACITPTDSFLPGTSFIQGWGLSGTERRALYN